MTPPGAPADRATYFASTSTSRLTPAPTSRRPRVVLESVCGIERDPEACGGAVVTTHVGDGQAHAVDGDRALLDHVALETVAELDRHAQRAVGARSPIDDGSDAVDVALYEVTAQAVSQPDGTFEVDRVAVREGPERRPLEGLGLGVGGPPPRSLVDQRQAAAVHRDRGSENRVVEDCPALDLDPSRSITMRDGADRTQLLDDAREHQRSASGT